MKTNKRHGISLIVLVITIIVMIILAAAIILSLNSAGIIGKANQAKNDTNDKQLLEAASLHLAEYELAEKTGDTSIAGKDEQTYIREKLVTDGFTQEEADRVTVVDGEIVLADSDDAGNTYNGVRIPEGFVPSIYEGETDAAAGLVIYQTTSLDGVEHETAMTTYDQYVWVPVDENTSYGSFINWDDRTSYYEGEYNPDNAEEVAEYTAIKQSMQDNGGFYIARYDAGLPSGVTLDTANYGQNEGDLTIPVSVRGATTWVSIPWDNTGVGAGYEAGLGDWNNPGCAKVARATLNNSDVKSNLIYGFQHTLALNFAGKNNISWQAECMWNMYILADKDINNFFRSMEGMGTMGIGDIVDTCGFRVALYLQ